MPKKINISPEGFKQGFDKWYGHWKGPHKPDANCDYCKEAGEHHDSLTADAREATLTCSLCALDDTLACLVYYRRYQGMVRNANTMDEANTMQAKEEAAKILGIIILDGRRLGYEMDEDKVKEVTGGDDA